MHPAARVQTAIELLDAIIAAAREGGAAADVVATRFFKQRRYAGSGDRRAIRELVWAAIRRFGERPASARAAMLSMADSDATLAAHFTGEGKAPAVIGHGERRAGGGTAPEWLLKHLDPRIDGAEIAALLERAPLDVRINRAHSGGVTLPDGEPLGAPLDGLRLPADTNIADHPAVLAGAIEVQDAGSQSIAACCLVKPEMTVIDLCAGAGGKTLALAAMMDGRGPLIAADVDRGRLSKLGPRAERAGAVNIETVLMNPGQELAALADFAGRVDVVLIDALCSGSGTWRRNPEGRWRLTPDRLARLMATQSYLLDLAALLVASGGHIVYATCSVITGEGEGQVEQFLGRHTGFRPESIGDIGRTAGAGRLLTPLHDGSDGFFMARLRRG
ncbi:MAG: RsmB/NOP family class I SAM-dependent RNA methyltransferase [Sphingopyxis sp.]